MEKIILVANVVMVNVHSAGKIQNEIVVLQIDIIIQIVNGTKGHMAVYGPVFQPLVLASYT